MKKSRKSCEIDKRVAYCGERSLLMEKFSRRVSNLFFGPHLGLFPYLIVANIQLHPLLAFERERPKKIRVEKKTKTFSGSQKKSPQVAAFAHFLLIKGKCLRASAVCSVLLITMHFNFTSNICPRRHPGIKK
jgi:hypothetical protein